MVGGAAGVESAAALLSRFWAGTYADTRGAMRAMVVGLSMGAASGLLYLLPLRVAHTPSASILVLLIGRVFLGGAESVVITGALGQGLALGGPRNAGEVIAWVGTALWAAYGAGAPVGFGAISTFASLLFAERGWGAAWVAFTVLSATFSLGRVLFGHLPDRVEGLPNTTAAFRLSPRSVARFIGDPLNTAENSARDMPNSSRASVRASLPASASRGANGDSSGNPRANRTFHGQTPWEEWRHTHFAIPLATGARTLKQATT
ncbi:MAG TPA: hypothetical protein VGD56_17495 [Gemmatirosa sp.]